METIKSETFQGIRNNTIIDYYIYKSVNIQERTIIPHFWGKEIQTIVTLDLQFPIGKYDCIDSAWGYCEEGYGIPVFNDLQKAKEFIDNLI